MSRKIAFGAAFVALLLIGGIVVLNRPGRKDPASALGAFVEPAGDRVDVAGPRGEPIARTTRPDETTVLTGADGSRGGSEPRSFAPGRLVVRFDEGTTDAAKASIREQIGARLVRPLPLPGAEVVALPSGTSPAEASAELQARPEVWYSEPDFIYRVSALTPNDPRLSSLWGLHNRSDTDIDAPESWATTIGTKSVRVGVVDTGVAYDHLDLSPNIWINPKEAAGNGVDDDGNGYVDDVRGWDWVGNDNNPLDLHGHGTHVAGTIGARGNNGVGITGVSWETSLVPLRVLDENGSGRSSSIAAAFSYAGRMGLEVVNASLGGPSFSQTVLDAINASPQTLFVVAAGNEGANNDQVASYPCNYSAANIVCVAAATQSDSLASFSNYGTASVDLGAPGAGIFSTLPLKEVRYSDGFASDFTTRWIGGGSVGVWDLGSDAQGNYLADSPNANYLPDTDSHVGVASAFDLSGASGCRVHHALRLDTEKSRDLLIVEASRNGSDWIRLGTLSGSTGGGWTQVSSDISAFDGDSTVHLRFRLTSDGNITVGTGADIDDVSVRCIGSNYSGSEAGTFSGTSMAAPHVAGAAAVLKSTAPALGTAAVKSALLEGTVPVAALEGRTVTGGRLNLLESLRSAGLIDEDISSPPPSVSSPTPAPLFTENQLATPDTASSPSPAGSPTPLPSPSGEVTPTPTPSPTPSLAPSPTSTPGGRSIELRLVKHLVARGVVSSDAAECRSLQRLTIRRSGTRVATVQTDPEGRFKARLKDRPGLYVVVAPTGGGCERAVARARHRHGSTASNVTDEQEVTLSADGGCWTYKGAERRFADLINTARSESGRTPLRPDAELSRVARLHAREMLRADSLFHTPTDELASRVIGWSRLGENIGSGFDVASLHSAFLASPVHRDNILLGSFSNVGVGVMKKDGRLWVTVVFQSSEDPGTSLRMPSC